MSVSSSQVVWSCLKLSGGGLGASLRSAPGKDAGHSLLEKPGGWQDCYSLVNNLFANNLEKHFQIVGQQHFCKISFNSSPKFTTEDDSQNS